MEKILLDEPRRHRFVPEVGGTGNFKVVTATLIEIGTSR
jgi:hypothetical protein